MARGTTILTNFSAGELSPLLDMRTDIAKFRNGAHLVRNGIVMPHGGVRKRPGTVHLQEVKDSGDDVPLLVRFQFNVEQAYQIEFGAGYCRFYKDRAIITNTPVAITGITKANPAVVSAVNTFSNGDQVILSGVAGMTQVNGRRFTVASAGAGSFALSGINSTAYTTYTSGGTAAEPYEISNDYAADELDSLSFAQTANTLYIAHANHILRKLTRTAHTSWSLDDTDIQTGPFRTINGDESFTFALSGGSDDGYGGRASGQTINLVLSQGFLDSESVLAYFRLWEPGQSTGAGALVAAATISAGDIVTEGGRVYGVSALSGTTTWLAEFSLPLHTEGTVVFYNIAGDKSVSLVYLHDSSCIIQILTVSDNQHATALVLGNHVPASIMSLGTSLWEEGAWYEARGFPRVITLHRQRLWAASTDGDPQNVWASRIASYENFQDGPDDNDAIVAEMATDSPEVARWMKAAGKALVIGTASGEHAIAAGSQNATITPSTIQIVPQTAYGSSPMRPVSAGDAVLFGQRRGEPANAAKRIREAQYDVNQDKYAAANLTIISEHITGAGIEEGAYQADPDPVVWWRRSDGGLAGLTYEPEQDVKGWHQHTLGGTIPIVERISENAGADGDEIWMIVRRTIGGTPRLYVEYMTTGLTAETEKEDAIYLDSALTYDGTATTHISGLWHLEGETVQALADGAKVTGLTVSGGALTLPRAASLVHVGLSYTTIIESLDLDALAAAGTPKSRAKRISQVYPSVYRSLGGRIGPDADHMKPIIYRKPADAFGSSPPLRTELLEFDFPGGWEREARIRIEHDEPYPFAVLGIAAELNVSG